jgi:transposase-like protein
LAPPKPCRALETLSGGERIGTLSWITRRQTAPGLILCALRWYLRYSLSFRDAEELLGERGLEANHTTIWR